MSKSKYKKEYCQDLIVHMSKGGNYTSFADKINVPIRRLEVWEHRHEEFQKAKLEAFKRRKDFFEQKYIDIALGIDPNSKKANPHMLTFIMKNINEWTDKLEKKVEQQGRIEFSISYDEIDDNSQIKEIDYEEIKDDQDQ
jgi:hypothetical protein